MMYRYTTSLGNKRVELFDMGAGGSDPVGEENVQMASGNVSFPLFLWELSYLFKVVFFFF